MRELCDQQDTGSPGAFFIAHHIKLAGYNIDYPAVMGVKYDIELLSIHHSSDFLLLIDLPKIAPIRIIGGHPMQNNPLPVIPFCDAVFIGEGETAIKEGIKKIEKGGVSSLYGIDGWIVSKEWKHGYTVPDTVIEKELPDENPPYLNHSGASASWYIEIARGCPFKCAYCELGHSTRYRPHTIEYIRNAINSIDTKKSRKINIFAPDEASFPYYQEVVNLIEEKGCSTSFSSMRIDTVRDISLKKNHLIRMGIDGMTENTRFKVNKKITNRDIINYFIRRTREGYVQFKIFMVFGYEWENTEDFEEFAETMEAIRRIPYRTNISIRVKWTPFIPQPCTPLRKCIPQYDHDLVARINEWHVRVKTPRGIGAYITNDGIMGERNRQRQVILTCGDENTLLKIQKFGNNWENEYYNDIILVLRQLNNIPQFRRLFLFHSKYPKDRFHFQNATFPLPQTICCSPLSFGKNGGLTGL